MGLRELFDKHGCDKGSAHGYERVYEPIFSKLRDQPIRLLEIGVLRGASIKVWLEYFPKALVIAVDTFARVPVSEIPALLNDRVCWYRCDSTKTAINTDRVDIIIDDGFHTPEAQLATFNNYYPLLKKGGLYLIEDAPELSVESLPNAKVHRLGGRWNSTLVEIHG